MKHLVIGGAGFIGCNLVDRLLSRGEKVSVLDDLSRSGADRNLKWLQASHPGSVDFTRQDITRHEDQWYGVFDGVDRIYHLAGQVAVTTSVEDPRRDFETNALGTFNVLEGMRQAAPKTAALVYSSTNKVYGGMEEAAIVEGEERYAYRDYPMGVDETFPLDFHSPYGCSKGAGDQYVRDYSRIYGLRTIVFRQSCIYGPRQFGVEDQGWLAWFIIALLTGKAITIYGDGKQVRDVLYIGDLLDAYELAMDRIDATAGQVFNIGGGPKMAIAVWKDFRPILEELTGREIPVEHGDWRPGDQRIYVSNVHRAHDVFGWQPSVTLRDGIGRLFRWVQENIDLFS